MQFEGTKSKGLEFLALNPLTGHLIPFLLMTPGKKDLLPGLEFLAS